MFFPEKASSYQLNDMPDDWVCPDCSAAREDFDLMEER
ncbi:MAG: rubredoxin [Pseudomonadota bacterium]